MSHPTFAEEYDAIAAVLNHYIEGSAKADSALMRRAFDPQATVFAVAEGKLTGGPIEGLFTVIDTAFRRSPEARAVIARIDIVGTAANARIDTDGLSGFRFTDFINLLKVDGRWTIVGKIYHTHPAS